MTKLCSAHAYQARVLKAGSEDTLANSTEVLISTARATVID